MGNPFFLRFAELSIYIWIYSVCCIWTSTAASCTDDEHMDPDGAATWDSRSAISSVLFPVDVHINSTVINAFYLSILLMRIRCICSLTVHKFRLHTWNTSEQMKLCSSQTQRLKFCLQKGLFASLRCLPYLSLPACSATSQRWRRLNSTSSPRPPSYGKTLHCLGGFRISGPTPTTR